MNLVLLEDCDFIAPDKTRLTGRRQTHLLETLGVQPGETIRVGKIDGMLGRGNVEAIDDEQVILNIALDSKPPPALPLTLILALPRPKMLKRCLRMAAETGIKQVHLVNSYKVEKSYWQSPVLQQAGDSGHLSIDDYLRLGLEQAGDTVMPQVELHPLFKPFVEDRFPAIAEGHTALVAHPRSNTGDGAATLLLGKDDKPSLVCIGPEGGFTNYEVEKLIAAGARQLDLGPRIYRVETFLPMIAALIGRG